MEQSSYIPRDTDELYEKLKTEDLQGELSVEGELLIWRLPNGICLKIAVNNQPHEGYIDTYYLKDGREQALTHWHPMEDEIYRDLLDIRDGQTFWIRKRSLFSDQIIIMDKNEYERLSDREREKCIIL